MTRVLPLIVLLRPAQALADRDVGNGKVLYKEHRSSCHGSWLEGQANWRQPGEHGIWDVVAYIRSTWPERIRKIQAARNPEHGQ